MGVMRVAPRKFKPKFSQTGCGVGIRAATMASFAGGPIPNCIRGATAANSLGRSRQGIPATSDKFEEQVSSKFPSNVNTGLFGAQENHNLTNAFFSRLLQFGFLDYARIANSPLALFGKCK